MSRMCILALALALGACAPHVIGANERTIMVGNATWMNASDSFALAEKHCQTFGKHARLSFQDTWNEQQSYDCIN